MSVRSVSPPRDTGHSYAWWSGRLAGALDSLLRMDDDFSRQRAHLLLEEFELECARREHLIGQQCREEEQHGSESERPGGDRRLQHRRRILGRNGVGE